MNQLTPRQQQIVELRLQGLLYKEIARKLGITYRTVVNLIREAYALLGIPKHLKYNERKRLLREIMSQDRRDKEASA